MNLAAFRNVISLKTGIQNSGTEQALIDEFVNRGVLRVAQDTLIGAVGSTITMVDGTRFYNLPSLVLLELYYDGLPNTPITRLPLGELIARRGDSGGGSANKITHYALAGNVLYVYPTPTSSPPALQIIHVPIPTALSVTSDDPATAANGGIPTEFQYGIQLWALHEASDAIDAEEQANAYLQKYDMWLAKAREDIWRRGGQLGHENLAQVPPPQPQGGSQ